LSGSLKLILNFRSTCCFLRHYLLIRFWSILRLCEENPWLRSACPLIVVWVECVLMDYIIRENLVSARNLSCYNVILIDFSSRYPKLVCWLNISYYAFQLRRGGFLIILILLILCRLLNVPLEPWRNYSLWLIFLPILRITSKILSRLKVYCLSVSLGINLGIFIINFFTLECSQYSSALIKNFVS
jgi:hypothetical protein